jgi:pimeloyl-ACP methyl ester carboxylesterase
VAINRPGWDGERRPLDLAGNAEAAVAALDAAGLERVTVVGHSLGGAVAAWLAAEHPERVGALVLAAPSANRASLNRLDQILATPILGSALTTSAFTGMALALRLRSVRRGVTTRFGLPDAYLRGYARALLDPLTWHSFVVEQRMLVRDLPALEERLGAISAPTTIVTGTADRIVSPASARRLAADIPGANVVEIQGASHLLLQERPHELAELIAQAGAYASELAGGPRSSAQDSSGSG